jgi:hypothetical protein
MEVRTSNFIKKSILIMSAIIFLASCHSLSPNMGTPYRFKVPTEFSLSERTYAILDYSAIVLNDNEDNFKLDKLIGYVIHQSDLEACLNEYENFDYVFSIDDSVLNPLAGNRVPIYSIIGSVDLEMVALVPSWYINYYKAF